MTGRAFAVALRLVLLAGALTLAACARDTVVLLPGDDGSSGAIAVLTASGEESAVIDRPYTRARVGPGGGVSTAATDAGAVERDYGALVAGLPPAPENFILYFEEGTTNLVPESEAVLAALFEAVAARSGVEVQVTGHTDRVGTVQSNDELSRRRAHTVADYLIGKGLDRGLVRAVGRGEREPLVPTEDEVAEPRNRRVEVTVR